MPGLRYGPDITDDAEVLRKDYERLRKLRGQGRMTDRAKSRMKEVQDAIRAGFGDVATMKKLAKYSTAQQGYDQSGRTRSLAGVNLRGRPALPPGLLKQRRDRARLARRSLANRSAADIRNAGRQATKKAAKATKKAKKAKKAAKKAPAKKAKKAAKKAPAKKAAKKAARPVKKAAKKSR